MIQHRLLLCGSLFASMMTLPLAQGCSGDDSFVNQNVTDASGDDSTTTTTDSSTPTDSSTTPDSSIGTTLCAATSAYDTRCSLTDPCTVAQLANCAQDEAIVSANAQAAYVACEPQDPCPNDPADGGAKAYESCLSTNFGIPDSTLTGIASAYCSKCAVSANPATCETGPVVRDLAVYNDAILSEIQATCLPTDAGADDGGPSGECALFPSCARDIVVSHDPQPAACNDE